MRHVPNPVGQGIQQASPSLITVQHIAFYSRTYLPIMANMLTHDYHEIMKYDCSLIILWTLNEFVFFSLLVCFHNFPAGCSPGNGSRKESPAQSLGDPALLSFPCARVRQKIDWKRYSSKLGSSSKSVSKIMQWGNHEDRIKSWNGCFYMSRRELQLLMPGKNI